MKQQMKQFLLAAAMVALLGGQANANLLSNGSFQGGTSNDVWKFSVGTGDAAVDSSFVDKWAVFALINSRMSMRDAEAAPFSLTGQDGNRSVLNQGNRYTSHVQVVDVSGLADISGQAWELSVLAAKKGNAAYGKISLYGFNDFSDGGGVTVDLLDTTSAAAELLFGNADLIGRSDNFTTTGTTNYTVLSINQADGAIASDYNYLAVVLTGHASTSGSSDHFIGWDDVSLTVVPEPATLGLGAVFGGAVLFIRRRFMM